jgi:tryptophanyl-tRNA synthetase
MSKSDDTSAGTLLLLEDLGSIAKKIKRAVTDTNYDPKQPGAANLLSILSACTGDDPDTLAANYTQYGPLKADVTEAVTAVVEPVQRRYAELSADPATVAKILERGAEKAQTVAAATLDRARRNVGLLVRDEG